MHQRLWIRLVFRIGQTTSKVCVIQSHEIPVARQAALDYVRTIAVTFNKSDTKPGALHFTA